MPSSPACTATNPKASTSYLNSSKLLAKLTMLLAMLSVFFVLPLSAQTGDWIWSGGNKTLLQGQYAALGWPGVYGTLGVASPANAPGARTAVAKWVDSHGNFWMFGGNGLDANGTGSYLNDLWEFSSSTGEWTWVAGNSTVPAYLKPRPGVYGSLGVPAPGNAPGGREGAITWTDHDGNLWLFGGFGTDSVGAVSSELNDLWQFNPATTQWTWMGGVSTFGTSETYLGVYGTVGIPAATDSPGSRYGSESWTDANGNLWLFGGYGVGSSLGYIGELNDLWEFNPSTFEWTWMSGTARTNALGIYGTLGAPSAANYPGGRQNGVSWTDNSGNFWLFGGEGFDSATPSVDGYLNDLWEFNINTNEWTWMGGSDILDSVGGQPGVYGTLGVAAPGNVPGARLDAVSWIDNGGNLWLFGGQGFDSIAYSNPVENNAALDDLWEYIPAENEWIWQGGSKTSRSQAWNCTPACGLPGVYGTLDIPAAGNIPGSRIAATGWTDSGGNFWLFGGAGYDSSGKYADLNDWWEYLTPPSTSSQAVATPSFSLASGTYTTTQTVSINDATAGATIYYTTNGTTPTTSSSQYAGPISVSSSQTLIAIATANGFSNSAPASASYTVVQTPSLTWATPAAIPYGTALSATQLNASTTTAGTFTYSPPAGTVLTAGSQTMTATFTPTDTVDYSTATATVTLTVNPATPSLTWPAPAAITYGTALSAAQQNASSTVAGAFTYLPASGVVLTAGTQALTATFTPTDTVDYTTGAVATQLTVSKATPPVYWSTPGTLTYGTPLPAAILNAVSTTAGTFTYSPAAGAVLTAGTQTLTVTFTPADTVDYTTVTATSTLTVNQATPPLSWATPPAIPYGTALSSTLFNPSSTITGTFTYSPALGTVLTAGTHTVTLTFTPTDMVDYTTATASVALTVNQATPAITWPTPAPIPYGTTLSAMQLNSTSTVAGTFTYSPAAGAVLTAGAQTLTATFTPSDTVDYTTTTATTLLTVNKGMPSITWATPAAITYGTALTATQLNATSTVAGSFTYSPAAGTILGAGTQIATVTFTPTDTVDYSTTTSSVSIAVNPATPAITWPTPATISYGTALSATQLNASSTVAGTFSYYPAIGSVLNSGAQTLTVTFTPTNLTNYTTSTDTVVLTVNRAAPAVTWSSPAPITYGTALSGTQLNATSTAAGAFTYSPAIGSVLNAGTQTLEVTFTPTNTTDYSSATATVALTVNKATPAITWATPTAIMQGTALSSTQLDATSTVAGAFTYSPAAGTVLSAGSQTLTTSFAPTNTSNYSSATGSVVLTVNPAPSFTLSASPASLSVAQGASGTSTITLTPKNGFSSSATLAATGLPSGVTASFSSNPTTGTSVLTLTASSTATVGVATVTITGTSGSLTASTTVALTVTTKSAFACHVVYSVTSQWPGGFGTAITINNTGTTAISNWTLTFAFANSQTVTQLWNGNETQSGANVTVTNMSYNGSIPAGGSYNAMGFNGSWNNVTNAVPTSFSVNGTVCK